MGDRGAPTTEAGDVPTETLLEMPDWFGGDNETPGEEGFFGELYGATTGSTVDWSGAPLSIGVFIGDEIGVFGDGGTTWPFAMVDFVLAGEETIVGITGLRPSLGAFCDEGATGESVGGLSEGGLTGEETGDLVGEVCPSTGILIGEIGPSTGVLVGDVCPSTGDLTGEIGPSTGDLIGDT